MLKESGEMIAPQKVAIKNGMIPIDSVVKHYRGEEMPHKVYRINASLF